ncbi:hypothetical protein H696_01401 [Fonticula alba]|uniref:NSUN5/RCM1 N-terminal domain-containing protein n=1 Tax=Fonticula alba TaxID=691883 RepID=A0A058ZC90_FONAL|nr:hypothetical protein H696_01401 [Fonticula alba]KCV71994.1 hypothetical protein H696_01401 [Fonticula alba]|eukprot:XP_009493572.1 hypothetical protein H696_01401 [Fonticula alba]
MTKRAGGLDCITPIHTSFLDVDPLDAKYANVTHILLDPSCSGSGIVSRMDALVDEEEVTDPARLEALAAFQESAIAHAMRFPAIQRAYIYRDAAWVLQQLAARKGSLKHLIASDKVNHKRKTYALVCETLKYGPAIDTLIEKIELPRLARPLSKELLMVMVYETLLSPKAPPGNTPTSGPFFQRFGPLGRTFLPHVSLLRTALVKYKIARGVADNTELMSDRARQVEAHFVPKYVRVNALRADQPVPGLKAAPETGPMADSEDETFEPGVRRFIEYLRAERWTELPRGTPMAVLAQEFVRGCH